MSPTLIANLLRRLRVSGSLLALAGNAKGNTQKSDFYRSAAIVASSIVEALVYELVRRNTTAPDHVIDITSVHQELHKIKSGVLSLPHDVFLCKKNKKNLNLNDADFGKMLIFLKNKKLITYPKYTQLDSIRIARNKIHVQGVKGKDVGYTKTKTDKVGEAIDYLIAKL